MNSRSSIFPNCCSCVYRCFQCMAVASVPLVHDRVLLVTLCSIYALWDIGNHFITCNYSIPFTVMPLNSFLNYFFLIWTELILHVIRFVISCKSEWMTPGPINATKRQMVPYSAFGPELATWVGFLYFSLFFSLTSPVSV